MGSKTHLELPHLVPLHVPTHLMSVSMVSQTNSFLLALCPIAVGPRQTVIKYDSSIWLEDLAPKRTLPK